MANPEDSLRDSLTSAFEAAEESRRRPFKLSRPKNRPKRHHVAAMKADDSPASRRRSRQKRLQQPRPSSRRSSARPRLVEAGSRREVGPDRS